MTLILTLGLDPDGFARLDALRRTHFPPERNHIPAHLTLFQQLPDPPGPLIDTLRAVAADTPPLPYRAERILDFGKGAAVHLDMPGFGALHGRLRAAWAPILTEDDDRRRRPHVTVQNKVDRPAAEATLAALRAAHAPWDGHAEALLLWHYRGGPWDLAAEIPLAGPLAGPAPASAP